MRQVLFTLTVPYFGWRIPLFGYGLMLVLGLLAAVNMAAWRARREKLDPELVYDFSFWAVLGGLTGARLFYVFQYWGTRVRSVGEIFKIWEGGIVLYGGILGGTAAVLLYWTKHKFPLRPMMDAIAPSLVIGVALGRVGCFLNGCCWGDPCDFPWAVRFPAESAPWWSEVNRGLISATDPTSLPLHPTQLYSAIDGLIICLLLNMYYSLRKRDGEVFALLMLTYPITRFLIEYLRNDEAAFALGMTISQLISVFIFAGGVVLWAAVARSKNPRYADIAPEVQPTTV